MTPPCGNSLDWTAADSLATAYNIYESTDGGATFNRIDSASGVSASSPPATSYLATGLAAGATPRFYVTAQNSSGESGASFTVSRTMPAPFGGVITTVNPVNGNVTIHWAADAGASGYLISRTADSDHTTVLLATVTPGSVTSYTDPTADVTKAYTYRVTPYFSTIAAPGCTTDLCVARTGTWATTGLPSSGAASTNSMVAGVHTPSNSMPLLE